MRDDIEAAFAEAMARPGGAVPRGPQLYYVEIHPLIGSAPSSTAMGLAMLGRSARTEACRVVSITSGVYPHTRRG
ncbi:MAG: putative dioxygenase [Acidimicrobiales bacterium]|nr:putative dioxygenase [Acidimicrobiales bacterium]